MNLQRATGDRFPWIKNMPPQDSIWLVGISVMLFIMLLPISSYIAALVFIQKEWGLNNTQIGFVYSAYLGGYALSALFVIPLTDRFGSKHIMLWATILTCVTHILFPLAAENMISAIILRSIGGIGLVGVYIPGLRMIAQRFSTSGRGTAMGLFVTAYYGATAVSLIITGSLISIFDWRQAYLTVSLISTISIPLSYLLLRYVNNERSRKTDGRLNIIVLASPHARYLILGYTAHAIQLYAVRVWLPVFLLSTLIGKGIDNTQAAITAATVGGLALSAGATGPVIGGIISDRIGRANSVSLIFALSGTCALIIGWANDLSWTLTVILSVLYGWAISADSAIYSTGITELTNPLRLGSTMAIQAFIGLVGGVAGPIAFGSILDISPDSFRWSLAFSSLSILAIISILAMHQLRTLLKKNSL